MNSGIRPATETRAHLNRVTALLGLLLAAAGAAAAEPDPHYDLVLKAYRGDVRGEALEKLGELDPAPGLFLNADVPALRTLVRLFAALPDPAHVRLREEGFLKWRADRLPSEARKRLRQVIEHLGRDGNGPYPAEGKGAASTGFVRVEVEGIEGPVYSWWIDGEKAALPFWLPLVRANGLGGQGYTRAVLDRLKELRALPPQEPPAEREWLRLPELPDRKGPEVGVLSLAAGLVRAYRGESRDRKPGVPPDSVVARHLASKAPADRALCRLVAGLTRQELQSLEETGKVRWFPQDHTPERRRLLQPLLDRLNGQAADGQGSYSLQLGGSRMGILGVVVPEVEQPVFLWWIRSPGEALPAWIPLNNPEAVKRPEYTAVVLRVLLAE